jgi:rhodanese-related sulfurtransferase
MNERNIFFPYSPTPVRSLAFKLLKFIISLEFPTVPQITTTYFNQWLLNPAKPQPMVLDARSEAEYAFSHLPTSVLIDPVMPKLELIIVSRDTPIVIYCSIGYRSAKVAQQLQQVGFSHVLNLCGGIFQWANEGRPIFRDEHPTQLVHPYNAMWGKLLKAKHNAQK